MKKTTILIVLFCFGCTHFPYTKKDIIPVSLLVAGTIADMASTRYAIDHGNVELNPVLGKRPSNQVLITVGVSKLAAMVFLGRYVQPKARRWIFSGTAVLNAGTALQNIRLGKK